MFLKLIKRKSIQSFVNKKKSKKRPLYLGHKVKHIGVVLNASEPIDFSKTTSDFRDFFSGCKSVSFVVISETKKTEKGKGEFDITDFGFRGKIKNKDLKTFLKTDLDLLVNYHKESNYLINTISLKSKAKFKLGLNPQDIAFNDLILDIKLLDFASFKNEAIKYLKKFITF